jgi:2-iminobutanoate/2-iminopropanoate deaminase
MTSEAPGAAPDRGRPIAIDAADGVRAGPYSLAVRAGDLIFTSGQIGLDPRSRTLVEGGFDAEARQVFRNLDAVLHAAGLSFANVVKCTAFLTDVSNFAAFNEIYAQQFEAPFPARTTIGVAGLPLNAQVEVEMVVLAMGAPLNS